MRGSILSAMRCPKVGATSWRSLIPGLPLARMLVLGLSQALAKTRVGGVAQGGTSPRSLQASPYRLGCGPLLVVCDCNPSSAIVIEAVIVDLPDELVNERSHGKNRSGIGPTGDVVHDPIEAEGVVECLIVRLTVEQSLEPIWEIVRPGDADGQRISATERGSLGFFRIGDYVDSHLRWGRGSALSALTASKTDAAFAVVEAQRQARQAVSGLSGTPLHEAAALAQLEVKKLGSGPFSNLRPGLDPNIGAGTASLVLHNGNVPLTQFGLGSRRLLSLSIQENALSGQSIVAIDEVESGLDPHRLAHLIRYLKDRDYRGELEVIFTTHSALVVESLTCDQVFVVRSSAGSTTVTQVPSSISTSEVDVMQGVIRERPSAELRLAITTWIERSYHRKRRQRALGRLTPIEFETIKNAASAA
jgi:putative ATP-dependent endonuclease of OLD family